MREIRRMASVAAGSSDGMACSSPELTSGHVRWCQLANLRAHRCEKGRRKLEAGIPRGERLYLAFSESRSLRASIWAGPICGSTLPRFLFCFFNFFFPFLITFFTFVYSTHSFNQSNHLFLTLTKNIIQPNSKFYNITIPRQDQHVSIPHFTKS